MDETTEGNAMPLPPIKRLEAVRVEPGDVIVATVPGDTSVQQAQVIKTRLAMVFSKNQVSVMGDGIVLAVHHPTAGVDRNPGEPF